MAGQGLPELNRPDNKGSLYTTVKAVLPNNPGEEELELFRKLKDLRASQKV